MDKGTKMRTFAEHIEPKTLDEILDMPLHEATMQLDMNEGAAEAALIVVIDQGVKAVSGLLKYGTMAAKFGGKQGVKAAKKLKSRYSKQNVANRKRDKALSKAEKLTDLRRAKEDLFAAKETIEFEKNRLSNIAADEKAMKKAQIAKATKELDKAYKEVLKGLKKLKGVKL
jgi:hypothetical protein|tara:strand:- start:437 stop:949 length:513 start_codon:yes stop_codon:yes gene_type:complete